jgi:type IV secretion system protein VirB9
MTSWLALVAVSAPLLWVCQAQAHNIPKASAHDPRIGIADYASDDVYTVAVAKGVLTRIVLGSGEQILESGTGFVATCEAPAEWCIKADKGQNQIWVKPFSSATMNNLELQTTRGDYSFRFVVAKGAEEAKEVFYRVVFRHPLALDSTRFALPMDRAAALPVISPTATSVILPQSAVADIKPTLKTLGFLTPAVRNYDYSRKNAPQARDLAPSVIFDDGRFTYFRFEKAQEVPTVFAVGLDGNELRVATHSERLSGDPEHPEDTVERDYLVVQRLARRFELRLGALVIEVINNRFDSRGIETYNGTTTDKLVREEKP